MRWLYQVRGKEGEWLPWPETELANIVALPCCEGLCQVVAYRRLARERKYLNAFEVAQVVTMELVSVLGVSEVAS